LGRGEACPPSAGRAFALVEAAILGDEVAGAELIRPLRHLGPELDTFAAIPAPALQQLHMDPDQPAPSHGDGELLADFPARAIDALLALAGPDADTALVSVEVRHLGGALGRDALVGGAQPKIEAKYMMYAAGLAPTSEAGGAVRVQLRALKDALSAWHAGYDYYDLLETPAQADAVLPPASYDRMRQIKATYDPDQATVSAHPVRPAGH
jgi:hypothetical protein